MLRLQYSTATVTVSALERVVSKKKLINAALKALSRDFDMRSVRINNLTAYCSADCSRVVIKTGKENLFFIESLGKCLYSGIIIFDL